MIKAFVIFKQYVKYVINFFFFKNVDENQSFRDRMACYRVRSPLAHLMDLDDLEIDLGTVTDGDNFDDDGSENNSIIIDQTDGQVCFGELIETDSVSCIGYPNGWTWINSLTGYWVDDKSPVIVALEKLRGNCIHKLIMFVVFYIINIT